jgi:hypothetical protein
MLYVSTAGGGAGAGAATGAAEDDGEAAGAAAGDCCLLHAPSKKLSKMMEVVFIPFR